VSDYLDGDPFVDPNDPDAIEREERRREREAKRQEKAAKRAKKEGAAPPPPPPKEAPPTVPRTPEQEFWDEPAEPLPPVPGQAPTDLPKADPEKAARGRKRLLRRRKGPAAAGAAGGAAAAEGATPPAPPSGEAPVPPQPAPPTTEAQLADSGPSTAESPLPDSGPPTAESPLPDAGPPTGEDPVPDPAGPPTTESPAAAAGPPTAESPQPDLGPATGETLLPDIGPNTAESPLPDAGPPTGEAPLPDAGPPTGESPLPESGPVTAETPMPDPGPQTAESPRPDPNSPTGEYAAQVREQALPPRPVEQAGAGDWVAPPPRDDDWFGEEEDEMHEEGDPNMAGAARHGRRHGDDGGRRGGFFSALLRHPFRILAVIVLIVILLFLNSLFQPFHGSGHGHVAVAIPKGSSVGEVGDLLEKKGVISDGLLVSGSTLFQARVTLDGKRSDLFAGKFVLEKDMSYGDAITALSKEPNPKEQVKPGIATVTIPEGQSRPITAKLVAEDGIKGSYLKATKKSKYLNPEKYGGKNVKSLEGFLFPDTWELKTKQPVSDLVQLQLEDFNKKIKKVNMKYANSKNLTIFDVVTIASMVEREAGVPKQRKLVASVIYNRLHEGMTLGIDSTIRFATGNYEKPLTQSQLESTSPYNTRTHAGLPPGPINSPGLEAIQAAAHPAKTDYLFYVNNPASCDELTFTKTEAEFEEAVAKYEKAREANGGNEPSTCK
jgi:uncharacterized YceG family protein